VSQQIQAAKQLVSQYYQQLDSARELDIPRVLEKFCADQYLWRGFHPFNEIDSAAQVAKQFWQPLRVALSSATRRQDIFMAGYNEIENFESVWVCSMGHILGLFDQAWLGIEPTGKLAMLRYCEFNKVEGDKIVETAMFFDIPHFMMQAGLQPFPPQTGAHLVQPGPATNDGLLFEAQDASSSDKTLALINAMIGDLGTWEHPLAIEEELALSWHHDILWWGPAGIGSTYTIERYAKQHSGVFREAFKERVFNGHLCRFAEAEYGGFFGWPNLSLEPTGGFMGMPATGKRADLRVIDVYRRAGDKLAENWIFIDLLHFWHQQGVDILERSKSVPR